MDVGEWLKGIGLGQYEATFRAHDIDVDVLPDVTEADLEKIGLPLGARKRLMKAIANLRPPESRPPLEPLWTAPEPSQPPAAPPPPPRARPDAERRPITVMFCDLVGSTALASRLDAEDWRNLVNAYLDEASAAVTRLGGHVLKRLGDGLMALFGYPHAQENDAERAVRAALAIQRALGEMNARNAAKGAPQLSARIGLESGPVVVEATGEVFGEAPNIAARVQGLAEPGAVLVTANVQRQTAGLFVAEDKGACELKGVPAPVTLYRIVRASGGRRTGARTLTPLVGREEELELLRRRWERARNGAGQLTLIVGEPGIGKSRLVEEFRATLGETPHTWAEFSSSQLLQNTPLHPIAEWGRQRFGAQAPGEQRLADLENTLKLIGLDPAEHAPLIAPLVEIPLPEERAAKLAPEELRRRQLAALTTWFLAGARSQAVALAFEDLHWADPTSLDLMQTLAERGAQAPMLILATARPEFRPPWSLRSHHSVISLSPLDRSDVALMVGELAARHVLSKEEVEGVSERTGGVPLFVEEVTRLLLERGEAGGMQAIPPTLQQSLAARLDRLGDAREVAQIGAVLGRDFTYSLLSAVGGVDDPALTKRPRVPIHAKPRQIRRRSSGSCLGPGARLRPRGSRVSPQRQRGRPQHAFASTEGRPARSCQRTSRNPPPTAPAHPSPRKPICGLDAGDAGDRRGITPEIPRRPLRECLAELIFQNLARRVARQRLHDLEALRQLVVGNGRFGEGVELLERQRSAGFERRDRDDPLAPLVVRLTDQADFGDRRMAHELALDLGRIDVLAARDDHVLDAIADGEEALFVEETGVACMEPAVFVDCLRGRVGQAPVALGHVRPAHDNLALRARGFDRAALGINDLTSTNMGVRPEIRRRHEVTSSANELIVCMLLGAIQSDAIKRYGVVIFVGCCHWRRRGFGRGLSSRRPSRR